LLVPIIPQRLVLILDSRLLVKFVRYEEGGRGRRKEEEGGGERREEGGGRRGSRREEANFLPDNKIPAFQARHGQRSLCLPL
jgi:hypothetical protein